MPFNDREFSLADGQPIRLYQFVRGVQQWTYASGDQDIDHLSRTYRTLPGGISDKGISQGGEESTQSVVITAPGDLEVAQLYRGIPPSDIIELVIYEMHYGDTDYRASWAGEIQSVAWPATDRCEITCSPEAASLEEQGLRLGWERSCPHSLYGRGCNVERSLYALNVSIVGISGAIITVNSVGGVDDGWFDAGFIEWPIGSGNYDRRAIEQHVGNDLTLFGGSEGLSLNQALVAYPGCDQTPETCFYKFNNKDNNGGFPHIPGRSPFDGDPVF